MKRPSSIKCSSLSVFQYPEWLASARKMKPFKIVGICLVLALVLVDGWFLISRARDAVWPYNYRDEGGNVVFVTRKFDLILPGRKWPGTNGTFVGGNGVLMVRSGAAISFSHSGHPKPSLK